MNIREIIEMPVVNDKVHESIFRSYHVLDLVKSMLRSGDSRETILSIIEHIESEGKK